MKTLDRWGATTVAALLTALAITASAADAQRPPQGPDYLRYRDRLAEFLVAAHEIDVQAAGIVVPPTYCKGSTVMETLGAALDSLKRSLDSLLGAYKTWKDSVNLQTRNPSVYRQFLDQDVDPKAPNFWFKANQEISVLPATTLGRQLSAFTKNREIDCSPHQTVAPPAPALPPRPPPDILKEFETPPEPSVTIPSYPSKPFCSEAEVYAWYRAELWPITETLFKAMTAFHDYGFRIYDRWRDLLLRNGPRDSVAMDLEKEMARAHEVHENLAAKIDQILRLKKDAKIEDCTKPGNSTPSEPPVPPPPPSPAPPPPAPPENPGPPGQPEPPGMPGPLPESPTKGLERPPEPAGTLPDLPPFCSEEELRAWDRANVLPLRDALLNVALALGRYQGEVYQRYARVLRENPTGPNPAARALEEELRWESVALRRVIDLIEQVDALRRREQVVDCAGDRQAPNPPPPPGEEKNKKPASTQTGALPNGVGKQLGIELVAGGLLAYAWNFKDRIGDQEGIQSVSAKETTFGPVVGVDIWHDQWALGILADYSTTNYVQVFDPEPTFRLPTSIKGRLHAWFFDLVLKRRLIFSSWRLTIQGGPTLAFDDLETEEYYGVPTTARFHRTLLKLKPNLGTELSHPLSPKFALWSGFSLIGWKSKDADARLRAGFGGRYTF